MGAVHYELGEYGPARARQEEALRLYQLGGYVRGLAVACQQLGRVAYREGHLEEARRLMEESVANFRLSAWPYGVAWNFTTLGWITTDQGQFDDARTYLVESLRLFRDLGATVRIVECLEGFVQLAVATMDFVQAQRLAGFTAAQRHELNVRRSPGELAALEPRLRLAQQALGRSKAAAEWAHGATMSLDEAVESTLAAASVVDCTSTKRVREQVLTPRESEVAVAVAGGSTSRQIADQLVIAERTVETHLERIYSKLDIHSRLQLAAWVAHQQSNTE